MVADRRFRQAASLVGLLVLATALRLHHLDSQLWLDEMDAVLESIRRPALDIATRWPATTSHVLYDLCSHACVRWLGETALAVRLPAALFGVGGVAALFFFTEPALGHRVAVVASALLAVSYHHVFYSQNARGYTALVFFALLAAGALLRFRSPSVSWATRAGYVAACALATYAVVLGVFVLAGQAAATAIAVVAAWWRHRSPPVPPRSFTGAAATALLVIALLYAPFAPHLLRFTRSQARLPAGASTMHSSAARLGVATDAIAGLSRGLGGGAGLALAAAATAIGLGVWVRRDALSLAVLGAPVLVELIALLAADVPLSPRYFALALAPLVIALALGLVALAGLAARVAPAARTRPFEDAMLAAIVAACVVPLAPYYRVPKQDFQGAIDRVARLAQAGDGRVAVHYAARGICGYYGAAFHDVQGLAALEEEERTGRRLWVVTTLERFLAAEVPALHAHIQAGYRLVQVLPSTVGGAEMNIYERK